MVLANGNEEASETGEIIANKASGIKDGCVTIKHRGTQWKYMTNDLIRQGSRLATRRQLLNSCPGFH